MGHDDWCVPDDILPSILSRLELGDVVRCRCVCRRWKELISEDLLSNQTFAEVVMRRSPPMILIQASKGTWDESSKSNSNDNKFFLLHEWWKPTPKNWIFHKVGGFPTYQVEDWHNGFIFFTDATLTTKPTNFIIHNPINGEQVKILLSEKQRNRRIFAIYVHPLEKEYCTLWKISEPNGTRYAVLNLESKPYWKEVGDLFPSILGDGYCDYPVSLNDFIYWKVVDLDRDVESIMGFNIKKEELCSIPYPDTNLTDNYISERCLLDIDGFLSIFHVRQDKVQVKLDVWSLKDPERKIWTTSSTFVLNSILSKEMMFEELYPVTIFNDMLLFQCELFGTTLWVWNFKNGAVRELVCDPKDWNAAKLDEEKFSMCTLYFWSRQLSFASLKKCKPVIHVMEGIDE